MKTSTLKTSVATCEGRGPAAVRKFAWRTMLLGLLATVAAAAADPSVAAASVNPNPAPPARAQNGTAAQLLGGYNGGSKCAVRRITLYGYKKGYSWQQYGVAGKVLYTRSPIHLESGSYTWTVCVHGGNYGGGDNWAQASSLALAGHKTARLPNHYFYGDDAPNEYYFFGDYLTPIT